MADPDTDTADGAAEVDDAFRAIMEGLRTTLPGAQTLVGFLLIIPVQGAFAEFDSVERGAYYTAFFAAATGLVMLIAPAAHQRVRVPFSGFQRNHQRHLRLTVWMTIAGTIATAVAIAASVFLVSRIVFTNVVAALAAAAVAGLTAWAWFYVPTVTFNRLD